MWWSEFYLVATIIVVAVSRTRNKMVYDCAVLLLIWTVLVNATYRYGELELIPTAVICVPFLMFAGVLERRYRHWLTTMVFAMGVGMLVWTAVQTYIDSTPYLYKAVKNLIYLVTLISIPFAWRKPPVHRSYGLE